MLSLLDAGLKRFQFLTKQQIHLHAIPNGVVPMISIVISAGMIKVTF